MSDLQAYMLTQANLATARTLRNHAGSVLRVAQIEDRLAEIKSQHEPLSSMADKLAVHRDDLYAISFYVVVGRWPEGYKENK